MAAAAIAGCGDEATELLSQDAAVTTTTNAPTWSESTPCESVWQVGGTIPSDYTGCTDASGTVHTHSGWLCADDTLIRLWVADDGGRGSQMSTSPEALYTRGPQHADQRVRALTLDAATGDPEDGYTYQGTELDYDCTGDLEQFRRSQREWRSSSTTVTAIAD
jgi:hypothetical protein